MSIIFILNCLVGSGKTND